MVASSILVAVIARAAWHYVTQKKMIEEFMTQYDRDGDVSLSLVELSKLLEANGVQLAEDEVKNLFGSVDSAGDGFDSEEVSKILKITSDIPKASTNMQSVDAASRGFCVDAALIVFSVVGWVYMVNKSMKAKEKMVAQTFRHAFEKAKMKRTIEELETESQTCVQHILSLQIQLQELEASSPSPAREQAKTKIQEEMVEGNSQLEATKQALEQKVIELQDKAREEAVRHAEMIKRLTSCLKGVECFEGVASQGGQLQEKGAERGFAKQSGWCAQESFTFGSIQDGQLQIYESGRKLGDGRDCAWMCKNLCSGNEYAMKKYRIQNASQRRSAIKDLVALKSKIGAHERIMDYHTVIESDTMIFVLMEFIKGKDLYDAVVQSGTGLAETVARRLFRDVVTGVDHLHKSGVIHCDLKPENVMVEGDVSAGSARAKLIDFGCAFFLDTADDVADIPCDAYRAPEYTKYGQKPAAPLDMWRLGCTLYIMLQACPPFHQQVRFVSTEEKPFPKYDNWTKLSSQAQDLISKLIVLDPAKRLSPAQVLEHPWLTGVS
eukprot:TRINITY_DN44288_c0_g1_i1.p1 TRINITY_DN44288_c0_g1~~TRINITY_DN44288_c0_g1_i1.p1  ORF type:complete len:592 (-),score=125.56 TRINITY_DN44288_c0_g1_i1:28-1677(-)